MGKNQMKEEEIGKRFRFEVSPIQSGKNYENGF